MVSQVYEWLNAMVKAVYIISDAHTRKFVLTDTPQSAMQIKSTTTVYLHVLEYTNSLYFLIKNILRILICNLKAY